MSMRVRQLIFSVVFTASICGLAALLVYSAGYRFSSTDWSLQPTGSIRVAVAAEDGLVISLLPTGETSDSPNTSFTHLLPGKYHLYVEATGYQPLNLELTVEPKTTIILDPLRLWPTSHRFHRSLTPSHERRLHQGRPEGNS